MFGASLEKRRQRRGMHYRKLAVTPCKTPWKSKVHDEVFISTISF
jgi:hypothetical protein